MTKVTAFRLDMLTQSEDDGITKQGNRATEGTVRIHRTPCQELDSRKRACRAAARQERAIGHEQNARELEIRANAYAHASDIVARHASRQHEKGER